MIDELRQARLSCGWSQRTLADRIGTHAQTIKRLERGVGSVRTFLAAMDALNFAFTGLGTSTTLIDQLRIRRKARSLTIVDAARRAGLARNTVKALERGSGSVSSLARLIAVIAPDARRRAPERSYWGAGDKLARDSRFTPPSVMEIIHSAFGEVDLDPCGHVLSPVRASRRILLSEGGDGLVDDWSGRLAFVNPPYSNLLVWLRRAHQQWKAGKVETVVCLVPVRTDSKWFHETLSVDADIHLLRGRVRFLDADGGSQSTPFSLMLLVLGAVEDQRQRLANLNIGYWIGRRSVEPGSTFGGALIEGDPFHLSNHPL